MPTLEDWDVDRVDLKWEAPKNNGGAPITGYIIEKKEKYGSWTEALVTTVRIQGFLKKLPASGLKLSASFIISICQKRVAKVLELSSLVEKMV